jgi:hypothetical protein
MRRVLILAEGQTEERFIKEVLAPHLATSNVFVRASIVRTKEPPAGSPYKGGLINYHRIKRDVSRLLEDRDATVTSMFDLYGLPTDFPGIVENRAAATKHEKALAIQTAFDANVGDRRFRSFITLHEFETLVLASAQSLGEHFSDPGLAEWCRRTVEDAGGAELVNDGAETHPYLRLHAKTNRGYRKVGDGPLIVAKQGLPAIRAICPHFNGWLTWLESLD